MIFSCISAKGLGADLFFFFFLHELEKLEVGMCFTSAGDESNRGDEYLIVLY